jgi:hypothetical protein
MADRTNAELFSLLFEALARHVDKSSDADWRPEDDEDVSHLALALFAMTGEYDFSAYQMYCDEALARLGLARPVNEHEDNDEYEYVAYPPRPEWNNFEDFQFFAPTLREGSIRVFAQDHGQTVEVLDMDISSDNLIAFIREQAKTHDRESESRERLRPLTR